MLVDSGATHNYADPLLPPWLQAFMTDYSVLSVPHTIVTAGQHVLQGVATGTVRGTISLMVVSNESFLFTQSWSQELVLTCSL